jgi:phosphohistidine phosphatase
MLKQLILFRHAEAIDKSHQPDKDRELTAHGIQQSVRMGAYLSRENVLPDVIFTSSAERTRQTALIAADQLKFDKSKIFCEDDLYTATTRTFLEFITRLDNTYNHVICVGHNPTLSYLAEYLTRAEIGEMVTAGIVVIRYNILSWNEVRQGNGALLNYVYPDTVDKIQNS